MPASYLQASNDPTTFLSITSLMAQFAEIIKLHVDQAGDIGVRIYPYWIYEAEPITMLGSVTADIKVNLPGSLEHRSVHAYSIGCANMLVEKGQDGFQTPIIGSQDRQYSRDHTIDIWGFFEDDGTKEAQQKAIDETRLIQAAFQINGSVLKQNNPFLDRIGTLDFSNIAKTPFSDGSTVLVSTGAVRVFVSEQVQVS